MLHSLIFKIFCNVEHVLKNFTEYIYIYIYMYIYIQDMSQNGHEQVEILLLL